MILEKEKNIRGQVWIETVIYLLVGLAIIGAILAFVRPKIAELQDKSILDQSVNLLKEIDRQVNNVWNNGEGNRQILEIEIKKGSFVIDSQNNEIHYTLDNSRAVYSEVGSVVNNGNVKILTGKTSSGQKVDLWINYTGSINIFYNGEENSKTFTAAPTPYRLAITSTKQGVDFSLVS